MRFLTKHVQNKLPLGSIVCIRRSLSGHYILKSQSEKPSKANVLQGETRTR
jgi:hypothetical protein